ncbi:hypothetical protein AVEN_210047-1 [Araneus ventricosus]|uniref:Uncharacterized protein n=1 Tax=Araneus ventricosus TaxID=182803 RepID=A0A4Y2WUA0_ARAVE|nr:hypothetical protein AVEN_210047-1 [Araneus ventricosus]
MKQDLEETGILFLSSALNSRYSSAVPEGPDANPGDASGNKVYQKEDGKVLIKVAKAMKELLRNPKLRSALLSGCRLEKKGAHCMGSEDKIHVYNKDWNNLFSVVRLETCISPNL